MSAACARGHYHQWTLLPRVHTNCRIPDFRDIGSGPGAWDLQLKQEFFSVILSYIRSYPLTRAIAMLCWSSRLGHEAGDTSRDTWGTWGQFKWTFHKHNLTFNTFLLLTLNPWKVLVCWGCGSGVTYQVLIMSHVGHVSMVEIKAWHTNQKCNQ